MHSLCNKCIAGVSGLLIAILLLSGTSPSYAQLRRYKFERFGTEQGLSHPKIFCIIQDRQGFLWFGTLDGLNRYDGNTFFAYKHHPSDSTSLPDNVIKTLYEDRRGDFWVGTYEGYLLRFNRMTGQFYNFPLDSSGKAIGGEVSALLEDSKGNLWVGTLGEGAWIIDSSRTSSTKRFRHSRRFSGSIASNYVYALYSNSDSEVWLGTGDGLDMYNSVSGQFVHFRNNRTDSASVPHNLIRAFLTDSRGNMAIGTWGGGMAIMKSHGAFTRFFHPQQGSDVFALMADHKGRTWAGTSSGIFVLEDDVAPLHFTSIQDDPSSLSNNMVNALLQDNSGAIWIGTDDGLCKFVPRSETFGHYVNPGNTEDQSIAAILRDTHGDLWIGSQGPGLFRYHQNGKVDRYLQLEKDGLGGTNNNAVVSLYEDPSGKIWVGTFGGGVNKFQAESGTFKRFLYHPKPRFPEWSNAVLCIAEAPAGDLWLGTWDVGLVRLEDTTGHCTYYVHRPQVSTSLSNNCVTSMMKDAAGRLWLGTEGGGLNVFHPDSGTFTYYRYNPMDSTSLSNDRVYALAEGYDGLVWVGTAAGLNRLNPATGLFTRIPGLESEYVKAIRFDKQHNVWISTVGHGIIRFSIDVQTHIVFDVQDGLQGNAFDAASFVDDRGMIYFGGQHGFNVFSPESIHASSFSPPVTIVGFRVFDQPSHAMASTGASTLLALSYAENFFSFEFAILDFTVPTRTIFAYKLEGFDRDWVVAGHRKYASYTNVPAGAYILRYKGTNSDGEWTDNEKTLPIIISPPFWETLWFRGLVVAFIAGSLYALYRYRLAQLLRMERMRVRIAGDLHDEIGSSLATLGILVDSVRRRLPEPLKAEKDDLDSARTSATRTSQSLRDIVWIINPEHDEEDIIVRMKHTAAQLLHNITYSFTVPDGITVVAKSPEFRQNLLLIFKEILHNIVKHSRATLVEISSGHTDGRFYLDVCDNGCGFDAPMSNDGFGLRSMQSRANAIQGNIKLTSRQGGGTRVHLEAKIPD